MIFFSFFKATMKVYQDFFAYKSGVYKKSGLEKTESFGYHSVRIIGWGEESDIYGQPIKYWVSKSSGVYLNQTQAYNHCQSNSEKFKEQLAKS